MAKHKNMFNPDRTGFEQFTGQVLGRDNARPMTREEIDSGLKFYGNPEKPEDKKPAPQPKQAPQEDKPSDKKADTKQDANPEGKPFDKKADTKQDTKPESNPEAPVTTFIPPKATNTGDGKSNSVEPAPAPAPEPTPTPGTPKDGGATATGGKPQDTDDKSAKDEPKPANPAPPSLKIPPFLKEAAGKDDGKPYSQPIPAGDLDKPVPAPAPAPEPISTSSYINVTPFKPGLNITADVLYDADTMIARAHDYGKYDLRMVNIAINAMAGDDGYVSEVLAEAKKRPQAKICKKERFYDLDKPNVFYDSFADAKRSFGSDVKTLESCGVDFKYLIGTEEWYFCDDVPVQPVSEGMPETPKPEFRISSHLLHFFEDYLNQLHDDGIIHPELGRFFKQIVLSDEKYIEMMQEFAKARREAQRRKMVFGYWVFDPKKPASSKQDAERTAIDEFINANPLLLRKIMRGHGKLECGVTAGLPTVQKSVYYATANGLPGEPVMDEEEAKAFFSSHSKKGSTK